MGGPEDRATGHHIGLEAARKRLTGGDGDSFEILFTHGSLTVEIYQPFEIDLQQPHSRDECYVIIDGHGRFEMGDETVSFAPGDFLFVPAGMPHRFFDFGDRMSTWVMFYGPECDESQPQK